ncbi:hypothetical protein ACW9YQ_24630 (plasmid) [Paraburkholderia strydomiana]
MKTAPTARQWSQARKRVKNVIEGPDTDIYRIIGGVQKNGQLSTQMKTAFPALARNERAQRVEAAVRSALAGR